MPVLEDRVKIMEAQTDKLSLTIDAMQKDVAAIRAEMATRADLTAVRTELHSEISELTRRVDRFIMWIVGTQIATLLAVIGVLVSVLYR